MPSVTRSTDQIDKQHEKAQQKHMTTPNYLRFFFLLCPKMSYVNRNEVNSSFLFSNILYPLKKWAIKNITRARGIEKKNNK